MASTASAKTEFMSPDEAASLSEADMDEAFALTEQEIFQEGSGEAEPENTGNRDLEQMEDIEGNPVDDAGDEIDEEEETEEELAAKEDGEPEEEETEPETRQGQPRPGVPPHRLREERQARKSVEQQLEEMRQFNARLQGQVETLTRLGPRPAAEQPQQPAKPDMFADPEGWEKATRAEIMQDFRSQQVNASMADAHEDFSGEFEEAYQALTGLDPRNPDHVRQVQGVYNAPNPGRALMRWYRNQETAQRVQEHGGDLDAYIQAEIERRMNEGEQPQRQAAAGQRQRIAFTPGARDQAGARRMPPSLNAASGSGTHRPTMDPRGVDGSEGSIFDYVFDNRGQSVR